MAILLYKQHCLYAKLWMLIMAKESNSKRNPDLRSFRDLKAALPATKIGAIVALLPEIHDLQRHGHKTRAIWESLTNDGLEMSYDLFRLYLGRARHRIEQFHTGSQAARPKEGESGARLLGDVVAEPARLETGDRRPMAPALQVDPFAAIRSSRNQKAKERFDYDPLTPLKEDLLK
jgi:hypothetical protein